MDSFFQAVKDTISEIEREIQRTDSGEDENNIIYNQTSANNYQMVKSNLRDRTINFSLNDANYLLSNQSYEFTFWCKHLATIVHPQEFKAFCMGENKRVLKKLLSYKNIYENEVEVYECLNILHYLQITSPTIGTKKDEWVQIAIMVANLHLETKHDEKSNSLKESLSNSINNFMRNQRLKKVPLLNIYSIISTALTCSFDHKEDTKRSVSMLFNIIQKDLKSNNDVNTILSLKALTWFPEVELVSEHLSTILNILASKDKLYIQKFKALLEVLYRMIKTKKDSNPNMSLDFPVSQLIQVLLSALKRKPTLEIALNIIELLVSIPGFPIKAVIFSVTGLLSNLISLAPKSSDEYYGLQSPWVQIKALRIIFVVSSNITSLNKIFLPLITDCFLNASNHIQSGNGILLECCRIFRNFPLNTVNNKQIEEEIKKLINKVVITLDKLLASDDILMQRLAVKMVTCLLPHADLIDFNKYPKTFIDLCSSKSDIALLSWKLVLELNLEPKLLSKCLNDIKDYNLFTKLLGLWLNKIEKEVDLFSSEEYFNYLDDVVNVLLNLFLRDQKQNIGQIQRVEIMTNDNTELTPIHVISNLQLILSNEEYKYHQKHTLMTIKTVKLAFSKLGVSLGNINLLKVDTLINDLYTISNTIIKLTENNQEMELFNYVTEITYSYISLFKQIHQRYEFISDEKSLPFSLHSLQIICDWSHVFKYQIVTRLEEEGYLSQYLI